MPISAPIASAASSSSWPSACCPARGRTGRAGSPSSTQAFINKFTPDLATNATELKSLVARKRLNIDVMVTEIANRTAGRPTEDAAFCSRHERAFAWALTTQVTSLTQVPSPYDFGPEMKVFPCPKRSLATRRGHSLPRPRIRLTTSSRMTAPSAE